MPAAGGGLPRPGDDVARAGVDDERVGVQHGMPDLHRGNRRAPVEPDQPGPARPGKAGGSPSVEAGRVPRDTGSAKAGAPTCGSLGGEGISRRYSRRRLLGAGVLAVGSAVLVGPPIARAAGTVTLYGLDPDGGREGCGCSACSACRSHAANKRFASAADADAGRAHPHCRCLVVARGTVEGAIYDALFVAGGGRSVVDLRHGWVQVALAGSSSPPPLTTPAQTPAGAAAPEASLSGAPGTGSSRPGGCGGRALVGRSATARLRAVWVRRLGCERRAVFVQLEASEPLDATISLQRNGRRLARRSVRLGAGRQVIRLPLATTVPKGPATVRVRFAAAEPGSTARAVSVPAKRPRRRKRARASASGQRSDDG